jgi:hypothetical protein
MEEDGEAAKGEDDYLYDLMEEDGEAAMDEDVGVWLGSWRWRWFYEFTEQEGQTPKGEDYYLASWKRLANS